MSEVITAIITALATVAVGYLVYKGGRQTAAESTKVSEAEQDSTEQDRAVAAWRSMVETLLVPLERRVGELQRDLDKERTAREDAGREHARRIRAQDHQIRELTRELQTWQRAARVLARWGTALRDEVLRLGGTVPATPDELLTLHAIEDAANDRKNPHRP